MSKRQSFYVGVKGIIQNIDGSVLIVQDSSTSKWELPGGRIDQNQSIDKSFSREISEELGVTTKARLGELVYVAQGSFMVENNHKLLLIFYRADVALPNELILSDEHSALAWVNQSDLDKYAIYAADKQAILNIF